jgi:RNA polymerase sigma factor (sigma-70 family)
MGWGCHSAVVSDSSGGDPNAELRLGRRFVTTRWSVVLAASDESSPTADSALAELCRSYWYPLYAFIRRHGHRPHDAQDSTQSFLVWLLTSKHLGLADPARGTFRSFLLARLKHFLSDERKVVRAQKRGGGLPLLSLDAQSAEERYRLEPVTDRTPERSFDQRWAMSLLQQAVARLEAEYAAANRAELFKELKPFHSAEGPSVSYRQAAERLGLSESAVKSAIFRLRQRHRELLREEVAKTVATPAEVNEEIRYLISVLAG